MDGTPGEQGQVDAATAKGYIRHEFQMIFCIDKPAGFEYDSCSAIQNGGNHA
jgi:hypothetical protein